MNMEQSIFSAPAPQAIDYEAQVEKLLSEMEQINRLMQSDRAEIEQLKEDSRMLTLEIRSLLTSMGAAL